jgi:hypothetical protein
MKSLGLEHNPTDASTILWAFFVRRAFLSIRFATFPTSPDQPPRHHQVEFFFFQTPHFFLFVLCSLYSVSSMTVMNSRFSKCWHAALPILLILGTRAEAASTYNLDTKLAGATFFDNFNFYAVSKQSKYVPPAISIFHPLNRKLTIDQGQ